MSGTIISGLFDLFRPSARAAGTGSASSGDATPGAFDAMLEGVTTAGSAIGANAAATVNVTPVIAASSAIATSSSQEIPVTPLVVLNGNEKTETVSPAPITSTAVLLSGSAYQPLSAPVLSTPIAASVSPDATTPNLPASVGTVANIPHEELTSVPPALTQDDMWNSKTGRLSSSPLPTPQGAIDDMSLAAGTQEEEGAQVAAPATLSTAAPATGAEAEHLGKMPTMYIDSPFAGQIIQRGIAQGATTRPAGLASWTDMPILLHPGEETTVVGKTASAEPSMDMASVDDTSAEDAPVDGNNAPAQDMFAMQPPLQFQMQIQAQLQPQPPLPVQTAAPEQTATASASTQVGIAGIGETKSVGRLSTVRGNTPPASMQGEPLEQAATPDLTPDEALTQLAQAASAPVSAAIKGQGRAAVSKQATVQAQQPTQSDALSAQAATAPLYAGTIEPTVGRSPSDKGSEASGFQMQVKPQAQASVEPAAQSSVQSSAQIPVQGQGASALPEEASVTTAAQTLSAETPSVQTDKGATTDTAVVNSPVRKGGKSSIPAQLRSTAQAQIQPQTAQAPAKAQAATPDQPAIVQTVAANQAGDVRVTGKSGRAQARQAAAIPASTLPTSTLPTSTTPVTDIISQEAQPTGEGPARMAMTSLAARLQSGTQASAVLPAKIAPGAAGEATALLSMIDAGRGGTDSHAGKGSKSGADALFSVATPDAAATSGAAALPTNFGRIDTPAAAPVADVGATLGQQVIDMSSGGQWIDGLAREIASLSAGTGQGSFRLSPEHLGPMRVDIRPGEQGSSVTLTVETKAAETALTKDKSSLQADARLSGVGIADVKIERVASVAETSRSETPQNSGGNSGNSQNPQSQAQQHQQQAALAQGNNGQGAGNGHQARKVFNDNAVSNGSESNERGAKRTSDDGPRARYA